MKKLNKIALLSIVLLMGVFSSCSDYRTERGKLDFETGRPLPITERDGGVDILFDLRDTDIQSNGRWRDDILNVGLYNSRIYIESRDMRENDYITIILDDGRYRYEMNVRPNTREGVYINGLDVDARLCDYMDGVVRKVVSRGRLDFIVTVIWKDYRGAPVTNAEVFVRIENDLDMRVRDN